MHRLRLSVLVAFISCAGIGGAMLAGTACTGEDPDLTSSTGSDGASGDGNGNGESDGGNAGSPLLKLEADPLVIVTGTSDMLRLRVVERHNVGVVTFRIDGKPEGVTIPGVAKLGEADTAIDIPVSTLASTRHGDYPITLTAEGLPFEAKATIVVRGLPGSVDTGFGTDGTAVLLETPGGDHRIFPLADGRVLLAWTAGGRPVVRLLDPKGTPIQPAITIAHEGTLDAVATFADSSIVLAIHQSKDVRLAWYTATLAPGPTMVVSSSSEPSLLASSPAGALFAQPTIVDGGTATVIQRYLASGAKDPAFADGVMDAHEPVIRLLKATPTGAAWLTAQRITGADSLVYTAGGAPMIKPFGMSEVCSVGADVDGDLVARCTGEDEPRRRIRRYGPDGSRRTSFGVGGDLLGPWLDNARAIVSNHVDRFYVTSVVSGAFTTEVRAFDGNGVTRSVFGAQGSLTIPGSDGAIVVAVDARGRLVAVDPIYESTTLVVRVRRYWD